MRAVPWITMAAMFDVRPAVFGFTSGLQRQIVAESDVHDLGYWMRHPLVARAVGAVERDDPGTMTVWLMLRPGPLQTGSTAPCESDTDGPQRAPDLELFGRGAPDVGFWRSCPDMQHLDLFHDPPCEQGDAAGWWVARLWLSPPPHRSELRVKEPPGSGRGLSIAL